MSDKGFEWTEITEQFRFYLVKVLRPEGANKFVLLPLYRVAE